MITEALSPEDRLKSLPEDVRASAAKHDLKNINDFIERTEEMASLYQDDPEYFDAKIQRVNALRSLMPILTASAEYIKKTEASQPFEFLCSTKIPLDILLQAFSVEHDIQEQLVFDGFLAIAIFNLLENANKYRAGDGSIEAEICAQGLVIKNRSTKRLPENLYEPGVKGSEEGTGLGLFIARVYAEKQNCNIVHDCEEQRDGNFEVSATIALESKV